MNEIAVRPSNNQVDPTVLEQVVAGGDLSKLTPIQRVQYYTRLCASLGLNPLTKPFQYISLQNRLTLYPTRDATDQLRRLHHVSRKIVSREFREDIYIVTVQASLTDGTVEEAQGAVTIGNLKGDALCNALMKAETKAKRRATLAAVGLGWVDESELETIPEAAPAVVNVETGEILRPQLTAGEPDPDPALRFRSAVQRLTQPLRDAAEAWRVQMDEAETIDELADVVSRLNANKMSVKATMPALGAYATARKAQLEEAAEGEGEAADEDNSPF